MIWLIKDDNINTVFTIFYFFLFFYSNQILNVNLWRFNEARQFFNYSITLQYNIGILYET